MMAFPFNYIATIFSPMKCFTNREGYRWWQVILLILLMTSLLLAPIGLVLGKLTYVGLDQFMPNAEKLLTDQVAQRLANLDWALLEGPQLVLQTDEGSVWVASNLEDFDMKETLVGLTPKAFVMQEEDRASLEQEMREPLVLSDFASGDALKTALSKRWFEANYAAVLLTVFINAWVLVILSFTLLLFGVAGLLSFMRLTPIFSINSFQEALTVCLNCFGVPTILAMLFGYLTGNPVHILTAQGLLFLLMLAVVYWQTRFQDRYVFEKVHAKSVSSKDK